MSFPLAQAAINDPPLWAQYGLLGLIIACLIFGWLVPKYVSERETKRAVEAEAKLDAYRTKVEEQIIPLLARTTEAVVQATQVLERDRTDGRRAT